MIMTTWRFEAAFSNKVNLSESLKSRYEAGWDSDKNWLIEHVTVHLQMMNNNKLKISDGLWPAGQHISEIKHIHAAALPHSCSRRSSARHRRVSPSWLWKGRRWGSGEVVRCIPVLRQSAADCLPLTPGQGLLGAICPVCLPLISHKTRWHHHSQQPQKEKKSPRRREDLCMWTWGQSLAEEFCYVFLKWREFYVNKAFGPDVNSY